MFASFNANRAQVLERPQLMRLVPSAFAEHANTNTTSSRYEFFSTARMIDTLVAEGWQAVAALQSSARADERQGFQKHMIRFINGRIPQEVGGTILSMVLINAHDGTSSYQMLGGLLRRACGNGLMVDDKTFQPVRFKHTGFDEGEVIEASYRVIEDLPQISERVGELSSIRLTEHERLAFARAALELRWENEDGKSTAPVKPERLLTVHRSDDNQDDLYTTYNVVQENLVRGGLPGRTKTGSYTHTREVKGVDANVKLNKALWTLTAEMAKLKA
jgi:hypothetical protein